MSVDQSSRDVARKSMRLGEALTLSGWRRLGRAAAERDLAGAACLIVGLGGLGDIGEVEDLGDRQLQRARGSAADEVADGAAELLGRHDAAGLGGPEAVDDRKLEQQVLGAHLQWPARQRAERNQPAFLGEQVHQVVGGAASDGVERANDWRPTSERTGAI